MQPRLPAVSRPRVLIVIAALVLGCAFFAVRTVWRADRVLHQAAAQVASASQLQFTLSPVRMPGSRFEFFATPAEFRSAATFDGGLFVSGKSALFRFDGSGRQIAVWHVGQELPAAPLTVLAVRRGIGTPELWIGTSGGGVIVFDGQILRQLLPADPKLRKISALLPLSDGRVLVGTPEAGLFVTDGKHLELFHSTLAGLEVTALAGNEGSMWIGTRSKGAFLWQGGEITQFRDQLPDPQVLSILSSEDRTWIGTPIGVAEFSGARFNRKLADGVFTQALGKQNGALLIGTVDEGTVSVELDARPNRRTLATETAPEADSIVSFLSTKDHLLQISAERVRALPSGEIIVSPGGQSLTASHISALQADNLGHLWVGYFDRGFDVIRLDSAGDKRHFEDDRAFCINRIRQSADGSTMAVATANGLLLFDPTGRLRQILSRENGLIANHITDVLFDPAGDGMIAATPAGLSFLHDGHAASIYAFQGLVNNHVYTLARLQKQPDPVLLAGTLGGFSLLKDRVVQASYTTANSELRQNWITASAEAWGDLYLGTYGSGVVRVTASGDLMEYREFSPRQGRTEISFNAMLATSEALYAGTAGQGLAILHRGSDRWSFLSAGLPSSAVTALAEKNGFLFIGTDNGLVRVSEHNLPL